MSAAPVEPNIKRNCQLLSQLFFYQVVLYHNSHPQSNQHTQNAVQMTHYSRMQKSTLLAFFTHLLISSPSPCFNKNPEIGLLLFRFIWQVWGERGEDGSLLFQLIVANSGVGVLSHCNVRNSAPAPPPNILALPKI